MDSPAAFYAVLAVVWLFVIVSGYVVITSFARLQHLDAHGIAFRTLAGRKHLAWSAIRAPVFARQYGAIAHIVLRLREVHFMNSRRQYVIVASVAEASRIVEAVGHYAEVRAEPSLIEH